MEFIETPTFTRLVQALLPDEQYHKLQVSMMESPTSGDMIKGSGGIRKLRYALPNTGKSGGVRVIYYYLCMAYQIRLILIYRKGVKDDLSSAEKRILSEINRRWE